jgi:hypothetical protein
MDGHTDNLRLCAGILKTVRPGCGDANIKYVAYTTTIFLGLHSND